MHMLFLRSSLLLLRRKNGIEPAPHVISVTKVQILTSADSGNTYSLDDPGCRIALPLRASLTAGWTITVQCTVTTRYVTVSDPADVGSVSFEGDSWDGIQLDSLDAQATITFDGNAFQAVAIARTVAGYLD